MSDFSALNSAVKRSARTTQYFVLSALYVLGAAKTPVTAAQVAELLDLQLRGKAPRNIPKLLRRYTADVRLADKGPPLTWQLTDRGLAKLREQSSLPLPVEHDESFGIDIGVVCALEQPEFAAVMAALGGPTNWKEVGTARFTHVYRETEMRTDSGRLLKVVGTTSTSMGLTAASIVTTQLILQFRPRIVLMIGIAAGTRDGGKQFGDVLVADPSVDYNSGKVIQQDGVRGFQPDPYPIGLNARLRSVLHKYRGPHQLFTEIRGGWSGKLPPEANRLHVGPLGAADQVIDDPSRVLEIQQNWRKLIGVEMETYGVYRACYEAPDPKPRFISFKSVCDFAAEKSDSWQAYAAYIAAEFALRFLKAEWEALWPQL
jgi:nucleoside phosphorylase